MDETYELIFKVRVQTIYYQTENGTLGKEYVTSSKRVSLDEANELLNVREVDFMEILKVKYENVDISMTTQEFEETILL